jgi:hypothetical protein
MTYTTLLEEALDSWRDVRSGRNCVLPNESASVVLHTAACEHPSRPNELENSSY